MNIVKRMTAATTTLYLSGRLDTNTARQLDLAIDLILPTDNTLILDLGGLEYISSAGLRILLKTHKAMSRPDQLQLHHVNDTVMNILTITAFADFLNIQ